MAFQEAQANLKNGEAAAILAVDRMPLSLVDGAPAYEDRSKIQPHYDRPVCRFTLHSRDLDAAAGDPSKTVRERLSHSEISLTLNTYSHVLPAMQEGAAEAVDGLPMLVSVTNQVKGEKMDVCL